MLSLFMGILVLSLSAVVCLVLGISLLYAICYAALFTIMLSVYLFLFSLRAAKKHTDPFRGAEDNPIPKALMEIILRKQIEYIIKDTSYTSSYFYYDAQCFGNVVTILESNNYWHRFVYDRGDIHYSFNAKKNETWDRHQTIYTNLDEKHSIYELFLRAIAEHTNGAADSDRLGGGLSFVCDIADVLYSPDYSKRAAILANKAVFEVVFEEYTLYDNEERKYTEEAGSWIPCDKEKHLYSSVETAKGFVLELWS